MLNGIGKFQTNYSGSQKTSDQSGVKVSTVELKTSKPHVTRTAQIKTGFNNIGDYTRYLQGRYSYMNVGQTSISGIPTTVSVSPAFLEKCNKDPQKAAFLEENLAVIPECTQKSIMSGHGVITSQQYIIDDRGEITMITSSSSDPDGRIARANAERKAKEKQIEKEKQKAARDEEAKKQKALERRHAEMSRKSGQSGKSTSTSEYTTTVSGEDIFVAIDRLISAFFSASGFDMMI